MNYLIFLWRNSEKNDNIFNNNQKCQYTTYFELSLLKHKYLAYGIRRMGWVYLLNLSSECGKQILTYHLNQGFEKWIMKEFH